VSSVSEDSSRYFETRYVHDPNRSTVWRHIAAHLQRYVPEDGAVLELGAGYCDFSNNIRAATRVAMDIDAGVEERAGTGVRTEVGDCSNLDRFEAASFDVVFASNLLEHLDRPHTLELLDGAKRVLRPGGRIVLVQPNFRLCPREYFDDYTHVQIFTDRSLPDLLASVGFTVQRVEARFLPLTMKSKASSLGFLVPWYLRSPIRPLAGQMLVVASS
jgi:SAM-dependent methyltransferase